MKRIIPLLILAGMLSQAGQAAENTGAVIEKLVADVDKQLSQLEKMTEAQNVQKERLTSELDIQYAEYEAGDANRKLAARGEIVNLLARMNSADRKEVSATLDTVVNVTEALSRIGQTIQNSKELKPEVMKEHKVRLGNFVKNAAAIVNTMEAGNDNPAQMNQTVALKNSLIMLYRQLQDPTVGTAGSLDRIQTTLQTLEDVAVQLHILQGLLESERVTLMTAAHMQTVDLALLRLARARLGATSVAEIPGTLHENIIKRVRRAQKPINESEISLTGQNPVPYDSSAWELISSGEFQALSEM